eukprot:UN13221
MRFFSILSHRFNFQVTPSSEAKLREYLNHTRISLDSNKSNSQKNGIFQKFHSIFEKSEL